MTLPALVFVHGGVHTGRCWQPTIDEIRKQAPELTTLAVDLPGRGAKPEFRATDRITDWVDSVVDDVEQAGFDEVVIVGHSMAGLIVPGVVTRLGPSRVREMILAAAFVPPNGRCVADTLGGPLGWYARRYAGVAMAKGGPGEMPSLLAAFGFCNGMTRAQRRFTLDGLCAESPSVVVETVDRTGMPDVPRTWILTLRDRALSIASQRRSIAALGGVQNLIPMDTCHNLMVSEPELLAGTLARRCVRYRR